MPNQGIDDQPEREAQLGEAILAYLDARKAGSPPERDAFLARYPGLEAELRSFLDDDAEVRAALSPWRASGFLMATATNHPAPQDGRSLHIPPELIDHPKYRILKKLGGGGMGIVYLAEQVTLKRLVALKVMSPAVLNHPDALARFHVESLATAKLDHQNITRAFDADQKDGVHFLVLEYVEGISLHELLERDGPLSVAKACYYARQVTLGLQHAFEHGMVHRDVKPKNLMVTPKDQVKICDFGLARLRTEQLRGGGLTKMNSCMGTYEFIAPEQAEDARRADQRSDIYSLGCTLYATLTGHPPFQEDTDVELILAHKKKEPRSLHKIRSDVPQQLSAIIAKMLAKDPRKRYQKPLEVAQALTPFVKQGTTLKSPRKWLIGDGIGVGTLLLALLGMWMISVIVKTKHGTVVLENLPEDAEVTLDGGTVTVKWGDAKTAEISVAPGKKHRIQVKKEGFKIFGEEVEVDAGGSKPLRVHLEKIPAPPHPPLSPNKQLESVVQKLRDLNPGFDGTVAPIIENQIVTGLEFVTDHVTDISPLRALTGLKHLKCAGSGDRSNFRFSDEQKGKLADLSPLKGMHLTSLDCWGTRISDLSPLKDMSLTFLCCGYTQVSDLSPLKGMPLTTLWCGNNPRIADLSPLKGMKLTAMTLWGLAVSDLSPLEGMPLVSLGCSGTQVSDLSPLKGMPLEELYCDKTRVTDLSHLKGLPLKKLGCDFQPERDTEILRSIKTLKTINGNPAAELLKPAAELPKQADGFVSLFNDKDRDQEAIRRLEWARGKGLAGRLLARPQAPVIRKQQPLQGFRSCYQATKRYKEALQAARKRLGTVLGRRRCLVKENRCTR